MTMEELVALPQDVAKALRALVRRAFQQRDERLGAVEMRLARLESRPHFAYCGVWSEGTDYRAGDAVTNDGSLWICRRACATEPGVDFDSWTLAVKRGRDGRDRRCCPRRRGPSAT